jgi:hypothetical protein
MLSAITFYQFRAQQSKAGLLQRFSSPPLSYETLRSSISLAQMGACPMQGSRPFSTFALSLSCLALEQCQSTPREGHEDEKGNGMVSFEAFKEITPRFGPLFSTKSCLSSKEK